MGNNNFDVYAYYIANDLLSVYPGFYRNNNNWNNQYI